MRFTLKWIQPLIRTVILNLLITFVYAETNSVFMSNIFALSILFKIRNGGK